MYEFQILHISNIFNFYVIVVLMSFYILYYYIVDMF